MALERVVLTGWGLVAQALWVEARERGAEVLVVSRRVREEQGFARVDLAGDGERRDVTAPLAARLRRFRPSLVVHTAASTSPLACERDPRGAYRGNVVATRRVVDAAAAAGAPIVAMSTDWVFDGEQGGYVDRDGVAPRNVYGLTKAWAEEPVLRGGGTVIRGTFVGRRPDGREGFVERLLDPEGSPAVPPGRRGSPLWVGHLAAALLDLAEAGSAGAVHVGSSDAVGWWELGALIREHVGGAAVAERHPADGLDRPRDTSLAVGRAERLLGRRLPSVRDTVEAMLAAPALAAEVHA